MNSEELKQYAKFASGLAKESGAIMLEYFDSEKNKIEIKKDNSPVTIADKEINDLVIERIHEAYPDHGIIGEEKSLNSGEEAYVWSCDPIDGTLPYSHAIPMSMFSLALVDRKDGQPILGVIYDPFFDRLFSAQKGEGANLNSDRISVSSQESLHGGLVAVDGEKLFNVTSLASTLHEMNVHTMQLVSVVYAGSFVPKGSSIGVVFVNKTAYDVAALKIIIEEAGGKTSDLSGNEQRYDEDINGFVGSNGYVHEELLHIIDSIKKT